MDKRRRRRLVIEKENPVPTSESDFLINAEQMKRPPQMDGLFLHLYQPRAVICIMNEVDITGDIMKEETHSFFTAMKNFFITSKPLIVGAFLFFAAALGLIESIKVDCLYKDGVESCNYALVNFPYNAFIVLIFILIVINLTSKTNVIIKYGLLIIVFLPLLNFLLTKKFDSRTLPPGTHGDNLPSLPPPFVIPTLKN